jgi:DMSO/TMAO reductase YedYZ molybdopterin-dependent catalytic subunit
MLGKLILISGIALMLGMVGCGGSAGTAQTSATTEAVATSTATGEAPTGTTTPTVGALEPIVVPTLPAEIPAYTAVDPATGLHMTGTPQVIDLAGYRLKVDGKVEYPLSLSYDELRLLPKVTATPTLVCEGFFVDTTTWSGVPLKTILEMAGVQPDAEQIRMKAGDGYSITLGLDEALKPENLLAYEWSGQPLPVLHGFPLRAVIPGRDGNAWVKWLLEIVVE